MLIVFGGLRGTGKTTVARAVAKHLGAAYVRVDAIEAALWQTGIARNQPTGLAAYAVAHAIAEGSLTAGASVVVDAVNPVAEARLGWTQLAHRTAKPLRLVEVVCSDQAEHRRRVEDRRSDLDGHSVPTWREVQDREYDRWEEPRLMVDTAKATPRQCVAQVLARVATELSREGGSGRSAPRGRPSS